MRTILASVAVIALLILGRSHATSAAESESVDYAHDIAPLLETYCVGCHTAGDANGDLVLDSFADLIQGGEHGPAITPGEPDSSRLFLMISGRAEPVMPPDDMQGLNEAELALIRLWIEQGAAGPEGDLPTRRMLRTPEIERTSTHPLPVTALAVSPQDAHLAIARFGTVEIVDPASQETLRTLPQQPGKVNDLRFSADGTRLAVASGVTGAYGQATVHDVATGTLVAEFVGHSDILYAATFSPDGASLATAGYGAEVILWDVASGEQRLAMKGHNGAVFDLAFSPDGAVLASASADETVKLWNVATGERLDTLSQPQGEVWAVAFTPDGQQIVAASADNQFRVWKFTSKREPRINPLLETRFADETPLVRLAFTPDGRSMIVASAAGRLMLFEADTWNKVGSLPDASDVVTKIAVSSAGERAAIGAMDGSIRWLDLPAVQPALPGDQGSRVAEVFLQVDPLAELDETSATENRDPEHAMSLPRGAVVQGILQDSADPIAPADWFRFHARAGEVWMIETQAARDGSPLDSILEIGDARGEPVLRTRLQAVHESYFTFRGKNSGQSNDFRLFDWEAMELNDLLYSGGEVTRLWMYPRGPDSGFNVYPGTGERWTYFDTTAVTHALQEPAYIVRELAAGESPISNGLPVFEIPYVNDDDASRQAGADSRVRFTAPADGSYTIRLRDTRGLGGDKFSYRLTLRPAAPDFRPQVDKISKPIPAGAGREFRVSIVRTDDYQGPVHFEVSGLPQGLHATEQVTIEAGQNEAYGIVWADADVAADQSFAAPTVVARAEILGRVVERAAGDLGELKTGPRPQAILTVTPETSGSETPGSETIDSEAIAEAAAVVPRLRIRPGQTIAAVVQVDRDGNDGELRLGNEFAGRNMPHGVFVDNIGLSGLLILAGANQQQFFITAAPTAAVGTRLFHLKAEIDGGVTSTPIELEVLAPAGPPSDQSKK